MAVSSDTGQDGVQRHLRHANVAVPVDRGLVDRVPGYLNHALVDGEVKMLTLEEKLEGIVDGKQRKQVIKAVYEWIEESKHPITVEYKHGKLVWSTLDEALNSGDGI